MTYYTVIFYCNDEPATGYRHTIWSKEGTPTGAAEHVFEQLPPMPKDIVGCVIVPTYAH